MAHTRMTPIPSRETLAGLLAALYYAQYSSAEDKEELDTAIELALEDFDIGIQEYVKE